MKTKLLLSLFLIFIIQKVVSQEWAQYFDGADTSVANSIFIQTDPDSLNVWQIGVPHKVIFDSAATLPNALVTDTVNSYPPNNISRFQFKIQPWMSWGIFALQWKQKIDFDSLCDGGIIEYSIDHGSTWTNVFNDPYVYNFYGFQEQNKDTLNTGEYAFSGTDSTWRDIWLCFSMSWLQQIQDSVYFRFTLKSDSVDNGREGWMIDNLMARLTMIHTVKELKHEKYLNIYPNPADNTLFIEAQKLQEFHIIEHMVLINSAGQIAGEWKNIPTKFFIDTKKYANGAYSLKIKTNLKSEIIPVVIQHN